MKLLTLTCAQCGSSDIKLVPERNDMASCNYCGALFMISPKEEIKPEIVQEEEVDMSEVVYPVKPEAPTTSGLLVLSAIAAAVGAFSGYNTMMSLGRSDNDLIFIHIILTLAGVAVFLISTNRITSIHKEFQSSKEMREYNQQLKAAVKKQWAQDEKRGLRPKWSGIKPSR
ncbi:hypothetical protein SAMN04488128_1011139 [Chitinophaga eiseniae]|uniref:Uncharacterized protein n=1 Tax=Chitinophaga eiseniae TaxID=634771 RepID=A0A1T4MKL9_9BACT|nr:hypothetical protein [Chitinophaga eiseniae]SJZ67411.1 hypothetical protein SAMN04488128_1011139 [Chitinophaga eiseniae]